LLEPLHELGQKSLFGEWKLDPNSTEYKRLWKLAEEVSRTRTMLRRLR
jgi:hypothetical protein